MEENIEHAPNVVDLEFASTRRRDQIASNVVEVKSVLTKKSDRNVSNMMEAKSANAKRYDQSVSIATGFLSVFTRSKKLSV
jgi:N-acetylmuramoyl-L-alanine amidase